MNNAEASQNDRTGPTPAPAQRGGTIDSIWKAPGFLATMVAVAAAFGAWSLLLPVVPMSVIDAGGTATLAGATTGAFMAATVITQISTPWLLRVVGYRPVMVLAAFMLGVPALGHLLGTEAWIALLFSALRGIGFGAITVAESALIAELLPLKLLGKGTGTLGVFIGLSQMIALPVGLAAADAFGYGPVYVAAAVVALVAAVMCLRIPAIKAAPVSVPAEGVGEHRRVAMWKLVLVPALSLTTISMGFGLVSSFLPTAIREADPVTGAVIGGLILSVTSGASMVFRYLVGLAADRSGEPGRLIIPFQVLALLGMVLIASILHYQWSVWLLVPAALMFGGGFGAVQNEALLAMFHRLPRSKVSEASAVWNIFYDSGTGVGSVVFGAIVAAAAYATGFGAAAAVIAVGIVATLLDRWLGQRRVTEYDNLSTRLRQAVRRTGRPAEKRAD